MTTTRSRLIAAIIIASSFPLGTYAATSTLAGLYAYALNVINGYVIPLLFAVAFVVFLLNIYRYFIAGGADEEKVSQGRTFLMWSLVGFAVMISVWGLINLFVNTLGFNNSAMPCIPTFGSSCAGQTTTGNAVLPSSNTGTVTGNSTSTSCPAGQAYAIDLGQCVNNSGTVVTPASTPDSNPSTIQTTPTYNI